MEGFLLYIVMLAPVLLFSLWASWRVKSNFKRYSKKMSRRGITGADTARRILEANGLSHVKVEQTEGWLSDHYSPKEQTLRLSKDVFESSSIAAIGVAAHEAGHAIQHGKNWGVMALWQALAKPAAIGSNFSYWIILIGFLMHSFNIALIGVILFAAVVVFQIVTLPLEFNASSRAKNLILKHAIVDNDEMTGVRKVLGAAALTYVAAAAASITTLLYYLIQLGLFSNND